MFIDTAKISVRAGRGGDGCVAFHREKYITSGGPDGGDGGRGGSIVLVVDDNMSTLMDFRYKRKYAAENGENGMGKRCSGKDGADLVIKVPRGTLIKDVKSGALLHDMSDNEPFVLAQGGRGGWGNQHFATPTRQAPRFAKAGLPGDELEIALELKLLADVGLIGFPNVGKSTLLSVVSSARPKIANYHFTTLVPNLGVVRIDEGVSFVVADIPGIIEGAAQGAGLGHAFLRHVDRCRLLIHVLDASGSEGRDPVADFDALNIELENYSPQLASRPQIIAANKCDVAADPELLARLHALAKQKDIEIFEISAATRAGVDKLMYAVSARLSSLPPVTVYQPDYVPPYEPEQGADDITVTNMDDVWIVEGAWLARLVNNVNFSDYESRMYFDHVLRRHGVFDKLVELGISDGDTVSIYDVEFEYTP